MIQDLSGKPKDPRMPRPDSEMVTSEIIHHLQEAGEKMRTGFDDMCGVLHYKIIKRHENAAGKKLCGMCGDKEAGRGTWHCTRIISQPAYERYNGMFSYPCPAPEGDCPGFLKKPSVIRSPQPKKKGLPVPKGIRFLYYGRPGPGVVTVAWIESSPGTIVMGFSFCSPEDPWCKITGREIAMTRLYEHPLVMPYLYSPKRTVHETVRAVLTHDFQRVIALSPGATMLGTVPSWTKDLAKRLMGGTERDRRGRGKTLGEKLAWLRAKGIISQADTVRRRFFGAPVGIPLTIIARMMQDIHKLGNG